MKLPASLQLGIEQQISEFDRKALARAAEQLSKNYRNLPGQGSPSANLAANDMGRAAYLATRAPATYAAIYAVLRELKQRISGLELRSLLDLGAGPGTALWAAAELFHELGQVTLIERDAAFIHLGQKLAANANVAAIQNARWIEAELVRETELPTHDLVIISYALGELPPASRSQVLTAAWQATATAIAVIEPGTPRGFNVVLRARDELLEQDSHLVAPCPHERQCPMDPCGTAVPGGVSPASKLKEDWCHFAQRLERSALHRRLKSAELGYEDEKFSYIVAARQDVVRAAARVIRHPVQLKSHINLELCTPGGLKQATVTRHQKESFKRARKTKWGDEWQ